MKWRDLVGIFVATFVLVVTVNAVQGRTLVTDTMAGGFILAGLFLSTALAYARGARGSP